MYIHIVTWRWSATGCRKLFPVAFLRFKQLVCFILSLYFAHFGVLLLFLH